MHKCLSMSRTQKKIKVCFFAINYLKPNWNMTQEIKQLSHLQLLGMKSREKWPLNYFSCPQTVKFISTIEIENLAVQSRHIFWNSDYLAGELLRVCLAFGINERNLWASSSFCQLAIVPKGMFSQCGIAAAQGLLNPQINSLQKFTPWLLAG